jgi:pyrroloquinoline-quinone synthase
MNYTHTLISKISDKQILKHAFYQLWNEGKVPLETLQLYAEQYFHHVKAFPRYVSATHSQCEQIHARQFLLDNLIDEEKGNENHPELWLRFAEGIGTTRSKAENAELLPETKDLVNTFISLSRESYAAGLGALFAYEHQVPEVAQFKIEALKNHYSIESESALSFFEVHRKADVYHSQALSGLLEDLSPEDKQVAEKAACVAADQLWKFLDGIYRNMSV